MSAPGSARRGCAGYQNHIHPARRQLARPLRIEDEYFPIFYGATGPYDSPAFGPGYQRWRLANRRAPSRPLATRIDPPPVRICHCGATVSAFSDGRAGLPPGCAARDGAGAEGESDRVCSRPSSKSAPCSKPSSTPPTYRVSISTSSRPPAGDIAPSGAFHLTVRARANGFSIGAGRAKRTLVSGLHWSGPLTVGDAAWTMVAVPHRRRPGRAKLRGAPGSCWFAASC